MYKVTLAVILIFLVLVGCGGDESSLEDGVTVDDFYREVELHAGTMAVVCGEVAADESVMDTYACVTNSFENQIPFFATYKTQSIEGVTTSAIIGSGSYVLEYWDHDNSTSGGVSSFAGVVYKRVCIEPILNANDIYNHTDIFNCDI